MKIVVLLPITALTLNAGAFVNLTFDEPDLSGPLTPISPRGPYQGETTRILPGWTASVDGVDLEFVEYSPVGVGLGSFVTLKENAPFQGGSVLGKYSLALDSSFPGQPDVRIRQAGTVPDSMTHLWVASAGYVQIFGDGMKIGEVNPELGSWAFIDVSAFQNRNFLLEIRLPSNGTGQARFDVVGFTVPEPSTWALLGVGALGLGWIVSRRR